jgi:hypothetical protein
MPLYNEYLSWDYRHLITIPYTETAMLDFLDTLPGGYEQIVSELIEYFHEQGQRWLPDPFLYLFGDITGELDEPGCLWVFTHQDKYLLCVSRHSYYPPMRFYSLYSVEKTDQDTEEFKC